MTLRPAKTHQRHESQGFTLVEVLVAGVIMAAAMAAFARFNMVALANSRSQEIRANLEMAINNDAQELQRYDTQLSYASLSNPDTACANPLQYLAQHLTEKAPVPVSPVPGFNITREFIHDITTNAYTLYAKYTFENDKSKNTLSLGPEHRIFEISPNFSAQCITLQSTTTP